MVRVNAGKKQSKKQGDGQGCAATTDLDQQ